MNSIQSRTCQKLKKFYSVTGIPVAFLDDSPQFSTLYPDIAHQPSMPSHVAILRQMMLQAKLELCTPMVKHIFQSVYYCILRIDEKYFVQLGPVAAHGINFTEYYSNISTQYPKEVVSYHMRLIKGAPQMDLHYFLNAVILATDLLCDRDITEDDIVLDKDLIHIPDEKTMSKSFNSISARQISFNSDIYHAIETGNLQEIEKITSTLELSSRYYYEENDIHFLRIAYITYNAISCHYASRAGLDSASVGLIFSKSIEQMNNFSLPQDFWQALPGLAVHLCQKVHELHQQRYDSGIINDAVKYIKKHLFSKITVSKLEKELGVSRRTLLRHFKETLGQSPSDYIMSEKLEAATHLLANSKTELIDIATMLCFSSQSHFTSAFQKKYQCTPLQYRKAHHKGEIL